MAVESECLVNSVVSVEGARYLALWLWGCQSGWLGQRTNHLGRSSPATRRWLRSRPTSAGTPIFVLLFHRRECPNLINVRKATCANPSDICRSKGTDSFRASYSPPLAITTNQASPREIKASLPWMIYRHQAYEWISDTEGMKNAESVLRSDSQPYVSVSNEQSTPFK